MFWATADGLELMAPDGPTKDFLKAVDVFGGELTCCRLGHPNGSRCDKEELMLPMLGLYQDILSKADTTTVKPIFDAIFDVVDDIYPRTFEYVDEHGVTSTKPLFGDLIQAVNEATPMAMQRRVARRRSTLHRMGSSLAEAPPSAELPSIGVPLKRLAASDLVHGSETKETDI